jgi:hypothetical protein
MLCLLNIPRDSFRGFYIPALRGLVAAAEQDDNFMFPLGKVHPVTGAEVNAEFMDAVINRLGIAEVSRGNTADTGVYDGQGDLVFQAAHPFSEVFRFPYCYHVSIVSYGIHIVKRFFAFYSKKVRGYFLGFFAGFAGSGAGLRGRPGEGAFLMRSIASSGYKASRVSFSTPALRNLFSAAHFSMPRALAISDSVNPFIGYLSAETGKISKISENYLMAV